MCEAYWGIAFHSAGARSQRWYRVSRLVDVDGMTFELYWHQNVMLRGKSLVEIRKLARTANIDLASGTYTDSPSPRLGSEMIKHGVQS